MTELLFSGKQATAVLLTTWYLALLAGQTAHVCFTAIRLNLKHRREHIAYEALLVIHLITMAALAHSIAAGHMPSLDLAIAIPLPTLMWVNLAAMALSCLLFARTGHVHYLGELAVLACFLPPVLTWGAIHEIVTAMLVTHLGAFAFRIGTGLHADWQRTQSQASALSPMQAVKRLPEGMLIANHRGDILLSNDVMRTCLANLGIQTDAVNGEQAWCLVAQDRTARTLDNHRVQVSFPNGETRLFVRDDASMATDAEASSANSGSADLHSPPSPMVAHAWKPARRSQRHGVLRIIAYDITRQAAVNEQIAQANAILKATGEEMSRTMSDVREAAENEAMLRVKARVHDIIGQRLSLLHRSLEDNNISDQSIARMKPLLERIVDDLSQDAQSSPQTEVDAIIEAFTLVNVEVRIEGNLPRNPHAAALIASMLRESATNAVKHAQAATVICAIADGPTETVVHITNDGKATNESFTLGSGLTNMHNAVEHAGGTLAISPAPFTLTARIPHPRD